MKNFTLSLQNFFFVFALAALCGTARAQIIDTTFGAITRLQTFRVPAGVTQITIEAAGGQGGENGGLGAKLESTFDVSPGQRLQLVVGGQGASGTFSGGGGGASFIALGALGFSDFTTPNILLIAGGGGGGGGGSAPGTGASSTVLQDSASGPGGVEIKIAGVSAGRSGGGGGSAEDDGGTFRGGRAAINGAGGGPGFNAAGGYGGGGGSNFHSGGGGGGASGGDVLPLGARGEAGTSFSRDTLTTQFFPADNSGNGFVKISYIRGQMFSATGRLQSYTVPPGVSRISIEAAGGRGGNSIMAASGVGGKGARLNSIFPVTPGQTLQIIVGEQGGDNAGNGNSVSDGGGGGGGTFLALGNSGFADFTAANLWAAAGGGGGAEFNLNGNDAAALQDSASGPGGAVGGAGKSGGGASAENNGGGFRGGLAAVNGAAGGSGFPGSASGGFGGGGGADNGGGGGGGAAGGDGQNLNGGQGGTSFSRDTLTTQFFPADNDSDGFVKITFPPCPTPPFFTSCPNDTTIFIDTCSGTGIVNFNMPTVDSGCALPPNAILQINGPARGSVFSLGTTLIRFVLEDVTGFNDTCHFTVTLKDTTSPTFASVPNDTNIVVDTCGGAIVHFPAPTFAGSVCRFSQISGLDSGSTFLLGTTVNTFIIEDEVGNSDTISFTVTIADTLTPPLNCPVDFFVDTLFNFTNGLQTFTVPQDVFQLTIEAAGGQGGTPDNSDDPFVTTVGGSGVRLVSNVAVTPGQTLQLLVAGQGCEGHIAGSGSRVFARTGGGGATFVAVGNSGFSDFTEPNILLIAGGGGGAFQDRNVVLDGEDATVLQDSAGGPGGVGKGSPGGVGGGGSAENDGSPNIFRGKAAINGGRSRVCSSFGFGGGGGVFLSDGGALSGAGGGGGGATGGDAGTDTTGFQGKAGTSFSRDTATLFFPGDNTGNGFVKITIPCPQLEARCRDTTIYLDAEGKAVIDPSFVDDGSTACPDRLLSISKSTFTCADLGANTVILTATGANQNTDTCRATVTVLDTISPSLFVTGETGTQQNPFTNLLPANVGKVPSGRYFFDIGNIQFEGELDNDNAGGGWLQILNYVHQGGTNPALDVRNASLPLLNPASSLGDDESGSATWGHVGDSLASALDFEELRFYGITSGHNRVLSFTADSARFTDYVKTGLGSFNGLENSHTLLGGHTANLPGSALQDFSDQGDLALVEHPFYRGGSFHWNIKGGGVRWEMDDFPHGSQNNTIHRVWVRGDLSPDTVQSGETEIIVFLNHSGNATVQPDTFGIGALDICGAVLSLSQSHFDCSDIGVNTVQLTATDASSNSSSIDVTVIVMDTNNRPAVLADTAICGGDSIFLGGAFQAASGVFTDSLSSSNGCDSILVTTLTVNPTFSDTTAPVVICAGDSAMIFGNFENTPGFFTDSSLTAAGCDSVTVTELAFDTSGACASGPCGAVVVSDSNFMESTVVTPSNFSGNWDGVNEILPPVSSYTLQAQEGQPYSFATIDSVDSARVIRAGNSIRYFRKEFTLQNNEDVEARVRLSVDDQAEIYVNGEFFAATYNFLPSTFMNPTLDAELNGNGTAQNPNGAAEPFDSLTPGELDTIFQSGLNEVVVVVRNLGRASDRGGFSFRLDVDCRANSVDTTAPVAICEGDSALVFGNFEGAAGFFSDTSLSGDVKTTELVVNPNFNDTTAAVEICGGDSAMIFGNFENTAGFFTDSATSANGCDSVTTTQLIVNPNFNDTTMAVEICDGDSAMIFGNFENAAGFFTDSATSANGCDSVTTTQLIVNPNFNDTTMAVEICGGDSVMIFGNFESIAGFFTDSATSGSGCDSVTTTELIVNPNFNDTTMAVEICDGDSAMIFGNFESTAGFFTDSATSANGCDSVTTAELIVNPTGMTAVSDSICQGDSAFAGGSFRTMAGNFNDTLANQAGCDSIVTTVLIVRTDAGCPGNNVATRDSCVSDTSWRRSTVVMPSNFSGRWNGVANLPPPPTFTLPVEIGQPYSFATIEPVAGAPQVIKSSGNNIRYFRKTFELADHAGLDARFRATFDDMVEIWVNGTKLLRENSVATANYKRPAHDAQFLGSLPADPVANGNVMASGGEPYDFVGPSDLDNVFVTGTNTLTVVLRNFSKPNDRGGFSFRMDLEKNGSPVLVKALGEGTALAEGLSIEAFPNPTTGRLTLLLPVLVEGETAEVAVTDFAGKTVERIQRGAGDPPVLDIDLGGRASGLYFVRYVQGGQVFTVKVVRE